MSPRLCSRCCRRAAFTLTELLVVVLIISFLLAMLLPGLTQSRVSSQRNACTCHMRQLAIAVNNYMDSYKKLPVICRDGQLVATELVAGANKLCAVPEAGDPAGLHLVFAADVEARGPSLAAASCGPARRTQALRDRTGARAGPAVALARGRRRSP